MEAEIHSEHLWRFGHQQQIASELHNKPSTDQLLNIGAFVNVAIVHDDY
jgi:acyl-CoA-binding protein